MDPQNNDLLSDLLNSINTFLESAQTLEEESLGQLVSLIEAAYQTKNNQERKQKEEILNKQRHSMGWKKYVWSILQVVYFSQNTNQITIEHILQDVDQFVKNQREYGEINTQEFLGLLAAGICCLINKECPTKVKKIYLVSIIGHLFDYSVSRKEEIRMTLIQYCFSCLTSSSPMQAMGYTLLSYQLIFENHLDTLPLDQAQYYLDEVSKTGLSILSNEGLLSNSPQDLVFIFEILNSHSAICTHLIDVVLKKVPICDDPRLGISKEMQDCHQSPIFLFSGLYIQITEFLEKLLNLNVTDTKISVFSFSQDASVNTILNKTKKNAVQTLSELMSYVFGIKQIHKGKFSEAETEILTGFTQRFEEHLKYFLTQLHDLTIVLFSISTSLSYEQTDLVYVILELLNEMILEYDYYSLFLDNRAEVIVNIVLNLLLTTKRDHNKIKENSKDFANYEQDLVGARESQDLKSSAARFLYNYCSKIDGTLSWVTIFILKSIHMTLGQPGQYEDFAPFEQSLFFAQADNHNRIETGLLGLMIISELIIQRKDLIENLNMFLGSDFNELLGVDSMIVRSRLCLFMKEMISKLFRNNIEHFTYAMRFLFECLIDYKHSVVSLQAVGAIRDLVESPQDAERMDGVMFDLVTYVENIINHANKVPYFDLLMEIFERFPKQLSRFSANYIKFLVQRILREFDMLELEKRSIAIDGCFKAIIMIVSMKEVMDEKFISFEGDLMPLYGLLGHIQKIEFYDYLIIVATQIIKHLPQNSPIYYELQKYLEHMFNKNEEVIDEYFFGLFYYWARNGNDFITQENPQLLHDMVKICLNSIEHFDIKKLGYEYHHFSQACVCLQMLIQFFARDQLARSINLIFAQLDKVEKRLVSDSTRVFGFRFYQIYYCLLYYYPTETLRHLTNLTEKELLRVLVEDVPQNYLKFFRDDSYSRKMISLGLMSFFNNRSSTCHIPGLAKACFKSLIQVLRYVPDEQKKPKAGKNPPQNVEEQKVEEDFNEPDRHPVPVDLTCNEILDMPLTPVSFSNNKLNLALKGYEMPISKLEEYQLFGDIYNRFKQNEVDFNNIMMDILDYEMQNSLNSILSTKNVVDSQTTKSVVRKQMVVGKRADPSKVLKNGLPANIQSQITQNNNFHSNGGAGGVGGFDMQTE